MSDIKNFFQGKRVLVTGHTGFKGTWLTKILLILGADVAGFSLGENENDCLFKMVGLREQINHIEGDVRKLDQLMELFDTFQPEIVFHLAAQALVREGYSEPVKTYETNVMGTVNVLECIRLHPCVKSFVNVTTDKVYNNKEWFWGYREDEQLNGFDPYSNSKSCSELITYCYKESLLVSNGVSISTARAGNVIGGGDFSKDRIIPDCVRAALNGDTISVRNPFSVRPYQHVLEPLFAYLLIAASQYEHPEMQGNYNVGPNEENCITTGTLVSLFCKFWGEGITWQNCFETNAPHEANYLKLDCSKIKNVLNWTPLWDVKKSIELVCCFYKAYRDCKDLSLEMEKQINLYLKMLEDR